MTSVNVSSREMWRGNKWIHKTVSRSRGCSPFDESTGKREADSRIDETGALRLSRPVGLGGRRNREGPPAELLVAE